MKKIFTLIVAALLAGSASAENVSIWKSDGSLGVVDWSGQYRFAPENNTTGEECYAVPLNVWEKIKTQPIHVTIKSASEWPMVRVTTGWWSVNFVPDDFTISSGLVDNGDGTYGLTVNLADNQDLVDLLDSQHLLFTGGGYSLEELFLVEEGEGGDVATETEVIWEGQEEYDDSWGLLGHYGNGDSFKDAKVGDIIRCSVTDAAADYNPVFKNSSWQDLAGVEETKKVYETYFEGVISTEDALCYLQANGLYLQGVKFTLVKVELIKAGGTSGINTVKTQVENNVIYNLAGQKVDENYKGIVIKNGKKYFQK